MKYLIDTNICIYIMNKRPPNVIEKFRQFEPGDIGVSTITVSELQYGVSKSVYREKNRQRLDEFMAPFEILDFDAEAARVYGDIRFKLEKKGEPIGPLDLLIGAQALSRNLIIVTNNDKEFKRIEKLRLENWAEWAAVLTIPPAPVPCFYPPCHLSAGNRFPCQKDKHLL